MALDKAAGIAQKLRHMRHGRPAVCFNASEETLPDVNLSGMSESAGSGTLSSSWLALLRCPSSGQALTVEQASLVSADGRHRYQLDGNGIALFAEQFISDDAKIQRSHYDTIADQYIANLALPHTQEYLAYLDDGLEQAIDGQSLGTMAELCCGRGEAVRHLAGRFDRAVGVDVSSRMLAAARADIADENVLFVQGDATRLPLADGAFDSVVLLGGIHHINDRHNLFAEAFRVLKPGGRLYFREPVDDFLLWRGIRKVIYRLSPLLDHLTERPLRWHDTVPLLQKLGFRVPFWRTYGFFGFCLFMNSDVLVFNRLFRFLPNIRGITRAFVRFDDFITRSGPFRRKGLIVVGMAEKP